MCRYNGGENDEGAYASEGWCTAQQGVKHPTAHRGLDVRGVCINQRCTFENRAIWQDSRQAAFQSSHDRRPTRSVLSSAMPYQMLQASPEMRNCTVVGSRPVIPVGMTAFATTVAPLFAVMRTERGPGEGATGTSQSAPNLLQRMRRFVSGLPAAVRSSSLMNSHCNSTANSGRRRSQAGRILVWQESGRRSVGSMSSGLDT